ncbi:Actin-related protein 4 [Diplonema papillatum]|nr:Actin-related protein 4 [Diplonema papillatum]
MPVAVVDGGSHTTKVGLAGEALPWAVLPSSYGEVVEAAAGGAPRARRYWGRAGLERQRGPLTVGNPYGEEGQVRDFELWAELAASGIAAARLGTVDTIVVTERPWAAEWHSKRLVDALFNHLADTTRVAVVKQPSAAAVQRGAENCLIVDAGHSQTTVSPVFGAATVSPAVVRTRYGAKTLTEDLGGLVRGRGVPITPRFLLEKHATAADGATHVAPNNAEALATNPALHAAQAFQPFPPPTYSKMRYWSDEIVHELKCALLHVDLGGGGQTAQKDARQMYVLPDMTALEFFGETGVLAQSIFSGSGRKEGVGRNIVEVDSVETGELRLRAPACGLAEMACLAAKNLDPVTRALLLSDPLSPVGGGALVPNFTGRLRIDMHKELAARGFVVDEFRASQKHMLSDTQKLFAAWTGASIIGSWEDLPRHSVTRSEWHDQGSSYSLQRW